MPGQDKNQGNRPRSDSLFRPKLDEKFKGLLASSHNGLHKGLTRQRAIERQNDFASKLTPTYLRCNRARMLTLEPTHTPDHTYVCLDARALVNLNA